MPYSGAAKRLATPLFRQAIGRRAALRFAAARGRSLVLLYHRVVPDGTPPGAIVPTVPRSVFRQHLQVLLNVGRIVPLNQLLQPPRAGEGPRFAISFDDDRAEYVDTIVPELEEFGVTATFFLSGRALHGLPPYWWTYVEHSLLLHGFERTSKMLGLEATAPVDSALALERSTEAQSLVERLPVPTERPMTGADIRSLAGAGMAIGFHTLHHPLLETLPEAELTMALSLGREALAATAGTPVDMLAYPYGRATTNVAAAAQRAGYSAAFVGGGRPISRWSDPYLLARWEPGALTGAEMAAQTPLRLLRRPTPPCRRSR